MTEWNLSDVVNSVILKFPVDDLSFPAVAFSFLKTFECQFQQHLNAVNFNNVSQNVKSESRKRKYVIYDTESSQLQ